MKDIKGLLPNDLCNFVISLGEPAYRGDQIFSWIHKHGVCSFQDMKNLPLTFREELERTSYITCLNVRSKDKGRKGTVKYLLETHDNNAVEAVRMKYGYGVTACLSTQIGCKMACSFCASGMSGFIRNLTASEITDEALRIREDLIQDNINIRNIVLMGVGEPLDNYEASIQALRIFNSKEGLGISFRRMTISTCGLIPGIKRLAEEGIPVTLSVSLHAATDDIRQKLMPINRQYPIKQLMNAAAYFQERTGRRVTFEYALIRDINDSDSDAYRLVDLLQKRSGHVNLIPLNPVIGKGYIRSTSTRINKFRNILKAASIPVTIRRGLGLDVNAACGQLRRRYCR